MVMTQTGLQKAKLKVKSADGLTRVELPCRFNPKEISISKSVTWTRPSTTSTSDGGPAAPEFKGTGPRTLTMELLFDDWEQASPTVMDQIETLMTWTTPTPNSVSSGRPAPPILMLEWGIRTYFECYLKSVNVKYTMFRKDGTPSRATANCTFEETSGNLPMTNPTSGGVPGRRSRVVGAGDSLHSIAFDEYGKPSLWRGLAAFNGIDDPLRVGIGTRILVPPQGDIEELS
jgi:nucleoid-associated protein YgaU